MKIRRVLFSICSILAFLNTAHANPPTPMYIGVQGGYVDTNFGLSTMQAAMPWDDDGDTFLFNASIKNHVFGGRGYAGYQFNDYFALEAGYLRFRNTRYTNINDGLVPNGDISEWGVDVRAKVFLPMAAYIHLSPYLQAGGVYMDGSSQGGITRNGASDFGYSLHPVFGLGIGYNFTPTITGDISWATITKRNSTLPRIDMYFVGITYHFAFEDTAGTPNYGDANHNDP